MSALARYIVNAILLEHRRPGQLARDHDISRIYRLPERFKEGGYEALERCRSGLPEWFESNIDSVCLDAVPNANLASFGTEDGREFASADQGATWGEVVSGLPPVECLLVQ